MKTRTHVKAGIIHLNHGVKVRSAVKAGIIHLNHGLNVRSAVKAGKITLNHGVNVRTRVKAGAIAINHGGLVRSAAKHALVASALLAPTTVYAGLHYDSPAVGISTSLRFAAGALGAARNSSDKVEYIGCSVRAQSGGLVFGGCVAQDSAGVTAQCTFYDDPEFLAIIGTINSDSWVRFDWDENGSCTNIWVQTTSTIEPKK